MRAMSENTRFLIAGVLSTVIVLGLIVGSAIYLDKVLGPMLRGTGWEILALPGIVMIFGAGWAWFKVANWILGKI